MKALKLNHYWAKLFTPRYGSMTDSVAYSLVGVVIFGGLSIHALRVKQAGLLILSVPIAAASVIILCSDIYVLWASRRCGSHPAREDASKPEIEFR